MDQNQVNPAKLFVGNLSYNVTTDQLREKFSEFGTVVDAIVLTDKFSGRSKGFGFVTMGSAEEANAAVAALNEQDFDGRKMLVNVARPKAPREFGGGGGRGGGGGFNRSDRGGRNNY
jgi:cold-inducible RNA-binding protein